MQRPTPSRIAFAVASFVITLLLLRGNVQKPKDRFGSPEARSASTTNQEKAETESGDAERRFKAPFSSREEYQKMYEAVARMGHERTRGIQSVTPWISLGPNGIRGAADTVMSGRVLDISADNGANTRVATAMGGLWTYQVAGLFTFPIPLTENLGILSIGTVVTHPTNPNIIFIGTGCPNDNAGLGLSTGLGMFRSTDAGLTWSPADSSIPFYRRPRAYHRIRYTPGHPNLMHATADNGVFFSSNGGLTWRTALYTGSLCSGLAINPVHPESVLVVSVGGSFYQSVDSGATYRNFFPTNFSVQNFGRVSLACCDQVPDIMYAWVARADNNCTLGLFKSTDAGQNWVDVSFRNPGTNAVIETFWIQGYYNNVIAVCPTNPNIVLAGGGSLIRSTDGGASWSEFSSRIIHPDQHAIAWSRDGSKVWVGNDGGIAFSSDQGATWSLSANTLPVSQTLTMSVSANHPNVMIAGCQDNASPFTTDGGYTWKWGLGGDGTGSLAQPDGLNLIAGCNNYYQFSTNAGTTWSPRYTSETNLDAPVGYIGFCGDRIHATPYCFTNLYAYSSQDFGQSWIRLNPVAFPTATRNLTCVPGTGGPNAILYDALFTVPAPSGTAKIRRYMNRAWTEASSGIPPSVAVFKVVPTPRADTVAYAIMESGTTGHMLYKTTNNGTTWTDNVFGDLPNGLPITDLVAHPTNSNVLYIGTSGFGFFKTINGGQNWTPWNNGLPAGIYAQQMDYIDSTAINGKFYVVSATNGRGIWMRDVSGSDPALINSPLPFGVNILSSIPPVILGPGNGGAMSRSTNGGSSWTSAQTPVTHDLFAAGGNGATGIGVGSGGTIVRSTDSGATWQAVQNQFTYDLRAVCFSSPSNGIIGGDHGYMFRTTDGGSSWNQTYVDPAGTILSIAFASGKSGFAAGYENYGQGGDYILLLQTYDGGEQWWPVQQYLGNGRIRKLQFFNATHGYAFGVDGKGTPTIWRTTNGGIIWTSQAIFPSLQSKVKRPGSLSANFTDIFFASENIGWACGVNGLLQNTTDGGATWNDEYTDGTSNFSSILWTGSDVLATGGTNVWARPTPEIKGVQGHITQGWNLVSQPLDLGSLPASQIYPEVSGALFGFLNGYRVASTMENGKGYWIHVDADSDFSIVGHVSQSFSCPVHAGWNLVGAPSVATPQSTLVLSSPGLIISSYFGYDGQYLLADTLTPGHAYWVKCADSGRIWLDLSGGSNVPKSSVLQIEPYNTLKISDGRHGSLLYFTGDKIDSGVKARFELPPPPPAETFDARFADGSMLAGGNGLQAYETPVQVAGKGSQYTIEWNIHEAGAAVYLRVGGTTIPVHGSGKTIVGTGKISLRVVPAGVMDVAPKEFALRQNYPNPFNPSTTIRFEIAERTLVRLAVYDMLGRRVALLYDGPKDPGSYAVTWDAAGFSSGIYFCRLETAEKVRTMKMVLIR